MAVDPDILKEYLRESGAKYGQNAVAYIFTCPRCQGPKKLYISKRSGRFVCFVCKETENFQGRPEIALAEILSKPRAEIAASLYGTANVTVSVYLDIKLTDFFGDDDDELHEVTEIPRTAWPLDFYEIDEPQAKLGARYLRSRGIPMSIAKEYGIRYSPLEKRVVFPVQNHGDLYGWQRRYILPTTWKDETGAEREIPKILSSTGIPRDRTLMFSDRLEGSEHAILTEGPVDAIKAHLCGGNVCAMGKAVSRAQMSLLINSGVKRLYLALDHDAADEMRRLHEDYFQDIELYSMIAKSNTSEKQDLGAMTFEEVYELYEKAERLSPRHLFIYLKPNLR